MFWNLPPQPKLSPAPVCVSPYCSARVLILCGRKSSNSHPFLESSERRELGISAKVSGSCRGILVELKQEEWAQGETPGEHKAWTLWMPAGARRKELPGVFTPHSHHLQDLNLGCYDTSQELLLLWNHKPQYFLLLSTITDLFLPLSLSLPAILPVPVLQPQINLRTVIIILIIIVVIILNTTLY